MFIYYLRHVTATLITDAMRASSSPASKQKQPDMTMRSTCRRRIVCLVVAVFLGTGELLWAAQALSSRSSTIRCSIVTGANGYVGREIVHAILAAATKHDKVLCLVRPSRVPEEINYWNEYKESDSRIMVMPYDMLDGGTTLKDALDAHSLSEDNKNDDCVVVYHVASVFGPTNDHVQTALDNVRGTEHVVETIADHSSSSCRLVLTSSMAAVRGTGQAPKFGTTYTYRDWNDVSQLGDNWGSSYQWSKMEAERRAWELAKQYDVPMVSLCPSFVFGPSSGSQAATSSRSYSIELVGQWVRGESPVQSRLCVDVRDVALAHVAAGTLPTAVGKRYIVSKEARIPSQLAADALRKVATHPDRITYDSEFQGGAIPIGQKEVEAEERLKRDLGGLALRSVEETMEDMGKMLVEMS